MFVSYSILLKSFKISFETEWNQSKLVWGLHEIDVKCWLQTFQWFKRVVSITLGLPPEDRLIWLWNNRWYIKNKQERERLKLDPLILSASLEINVICCGSILLENQFFLGLWVNLPLYCHLLYRISFWLLPTVCQICSFAITLHWRTPLNARFW